MTFTETLRAILSDQSEIPKLPEDKLVAFSEGQSIPTKLPLHILHRLVRLQTLIVQEQQRGEMPDTDVLEGLGLASEQSEGSKLNSMAKSLSVQEDATKRILMLEQLIVEIVREAVPSECERFDVRYCVNLELDVLWSPNLKRRFLD